MEQDIRKYNGALESGEQAVCDLLAELVERNLPEYEAKIWHGHPVWFLDGNPVVGYSKQKRGIRLMFWSGAGFDEPQLNVPGKKFKDASIFYRSVGEVNVADIERWLDKSQQIAWDYKNITKRQGVLVRLK